MQKWYAKKVHVSWHIASASIGILIGAAGVAHVSAVRTNIIWWLAGAALCMGVCWRRSRWLLLMAALTGGMLGAWRGASELQALRVYQAYYGQLLAIRGVLREDVSYGVHGDMRFELQDIHILDSPKLHGKVWVSTAQKWDIKRGDTVIVKGKLGEGFGTLPASMYRAAILGVERPHPGDLARIFRDWFAAGVRQGVPEPQASLGIGYLTGQRSALPAELDQQLRTVGLTHAVVASGYNLTILVSFARNALAGISKYMATTVAAALVLLFMLVTGFSPSMSRAGLVSGLSLATWYYGRVMHPFVLLPFAAAITVLLRPAYAWGDIGWCLSFAAFAGVVVLAPLLRHYFWPAEREPALLARLLVETVSAQLATLPIILYSFGQYPAYALPANLMVVPLIPLAMVLTFIAGIAGVALSGLAHLAGLPATLLLHYMTWVVSWIADVPGALQEVSFSMTWLICAYALLSLLSVFLWRKTGLDFRGDTFVKKV